MSRQLAFTRAETQAVQKFARAFSLRSETLDYYPLSIQLEASSACNFSCIGCPQGELVAKQKGHLHQDIFDKVIAEIAGKTIRVGLVWRGEPLMNKRLTDMIARLSEANLKPWLVSNASLLAPERSRGMIEAGLDYVCFSMDGIDAETFEKVRVGGNFKSVMANLHGFFAEKRAYQERTGKPGPFISISAIDFGNALDREKVTGFFTDSMVDEVVFQRPHNWAGVVSVTDESHPSGSTPCADPFKKMVVSFDGRAFVCCMDYMGQVEVGDLNVSTVGEIWNGEKYREFRRMFRDNQHLKHHLCGKCGYRMGAENSWMF